MPTTIGLGALSSYLFDVEMDQMAGYVIETDRAYKLSLDTLSERLQKAIEDDPNGDHSILTAQNKAAAEELGKKLPMIGNAASFITIYSMMEHHFAFTCEMLRKDKGFTIAARDLSGTGIDQSSRYLSKVCNIDVPLDTPEWKEITEIRQLRNIVVHSLGALEPKHEDFKNRYVLRASGLSIGPYNQVILSKEYCLAVIQKIKAFMNTVAELLPNDV